MPSLLQLYQVLAKAPLGKTLYSRLVGVKAPYFASIRPAVSHLSPQQCEVRIRNARRVHNHLGTVHAIALCNMAELSGGLLTDANVTPKQRWIPRGMQVQYLKKAVTDLRAVATPTGTLPAAGESGSFPVHIAIYDTAEQLVFTADIDMWVTPKK